MSAWTCECGTVYDTDRRFDCPKCGRKFDDMGEGENGTMTPDSRLSQVEIYEKSAECEWLAAGMNLKIKTLKERNVFEIQGTVKGSESKLLAIASDIEELRNKLWGFRASYELAEGHEFRLMPSEGAKPEPMKPQQVNGFPRRSRVDLWCPAEKAIQAAVDAVEEAGADLLLTDAVNLLIQARDKVADWYETQPKKD